MISLFSRIITKIKKSPFIVDEDVSVMYVFNMLFIKMIHLLNGILLLRGICFLSPSAKLKEKRKITFGKWCSIDHGVYIDAMSKQGFFFGDYVSIQRFVEIIGSGSIRFIGKGLIVGNNVGIGAHSFLGCAGGIDIGDDTIIGNYVSFHAENHNFNDINIPIRLQGVNHSGIKIGSNCWIGAKAIILDGTVLGDGCIVGAGSLVKGSFPNNVIIAGIPAKIIRTRE